MRARKLKKEAIDRQDHTMYLDRWKRVVFLLFVYGISSPAYSQDADEGLIEEILVTGSHIRRSQLDERAPMQTIDMGDIEAIGASQPKDLLKTLTSNTGSVISSESGLGGTTQFSLRGLGLSSTLTLVNGRRAGVAPISDATANDFTDINQFPVSMIERVEVLTDGASATYGSEAVAGVVNIITRKGFEGFEISADVRDSSNQSGSVSFAAGKKFDGGSFSAYGSYYTQDRNSRSDFDWLDERILGDGDRRNARTISSIGSPGSYLRAFINADGLPQTLPGAARIADPDCEAVGGFLISGRCRYDFTDQVSVIQAEERAQVFTEFDYQLTDRVGIYSEASFSRNEMKSNLFGRSFSNGNIVGTARTFIPGDHPFNFFIEDPTDATNILYIGPDAWDPAIHTGVDLSCECRPLNFEESKAAGDDLRREFNYTRFVAGIDVDLPAEWSMDASYQYSGANLTGELPGSYRADAYTQLIIDGGFNPFGTRLSNPGLISPKDGVSVAGNSTDSIAQFYGQELVNVKTRQHVVDVVASGETFQIGGRPIGVAVGSQYRFLGLDDNPDPINAAGEGNSSDREFPFSGTEEVFAVFAEALLPITDLIDVQLAVRHEDFGGNIGTTTDPKVAVKYSPTDWFTFRGSWGTSFRAPTLRQNAVALSSEILDDPAVDGACGPGGDTIRAAVSTRGADDLSPQSADSFNIGFVFQPLDNLSASADFWQYDYSDLIAPSESAQAILENDCADDGIANDPRVIRAGGGQIDRVNLEITNIGSVVAEGVDLALNYRYDAGSYGNFYANIFATFVSDFAVEDEGVSFNGAGSRNFTNNFGSQPEWRTNGSIDWFIQNHSVNLTVRYIDGYRNDQSNDAPIDSQTTVDLQYAYTFDNWGAETVVAIGANNLFDEEPPALRRYDSNGEFVTGNAAIDRPGYDASVHDVRGRIMYLNLKHKF